MFADQKNDIIMNIRLVNEYYLLTELNIVNVGH